MAAGTRHGTSNGGKVVERKVSASDFGADEKDGGRQGRGERGRTMWFFHQMEIHTRSDESHRRADVRRKI